MTDHDDSIIGELLATWDDIMDGAAMQSAHEAPELDGLSKVVRYAIEASSGQIGTARRLASEIIDVAPELSDQTRAWLAKRALKSTLELASALDTLSVETDRPVLRALADCVRVVALPIPSSENPCARAYMRVGRVLSLSRGTLEDQPDKLRTKAERAVLAWAVAPILGEKRLRENGSPAIVAGAHVIDDLIEVSARAWAQEKASADTSSKPREQALLSLDDIDCPPGHVIVCRRQIEGAITSRPNDGIRPYSHVLNVAIPLIACPDLKAIRCALLREFPYAEDVIAFVLAGLVGRPTISFEPLLLVGKPGGGKSRFARRLCELLTVGLWRIDAAQPDGSACAGTDKRWSTASPSAPFLAVSRFGHANPILLVDELDKAATKSDYGRLWDVLVSLCERENTRRYPDPCLGVEIDISHISYIATANSTAGLPAPLLDRLRQIPFPLPRPEDIDGLVDNLTLEIARERGVDVRFYPPLSNTERRLVVSQWDGGSVRRLRRMLDVIFRTREKYVLSQ